MGEVEKRRLAGEDTGATGDTGVEIHRDLVNELLIMHKASCGYGLSVSLGRFIG